MSRLSALPRRVEHEPIDAGRDRPCCHADRAAFGHAGRLRSRGAFDCIHRHVSGLWCAARRCRDLLSRIERLHAGVDSHVRDDGCGDRLLAGRQGSLRSARPLALPSSGRAGDLEPRRVRGVRRAYRLVARVLRRHRQDGHSGNAAARLSRRHCDRVDLRRRHARHSDPAVDYLHSLWHCHRDLDRTPVSRRRIARHHAHDAVHAVDAVHHLETRLSFARRRFPLQLEREVPVDSKNRAVHRHHVDGADIEDLGTD